MQSDVPADGVPVAIRRIVTGNGHGSKAVIALDAPPPRTDVFEHIPGMISRLVWATPQVPEVPFEPPHHHPRSAIAEFGSSN